MYTQSRDAKGFSEVISGRVPPEAARKIAILVASHKIPQYKTTSDFVRDACLNWAEIQSQHYQLTEFDNFLLDMRALQDIADQEAYYLNFQKTVEKYKSTLSRLAGQGVTGRKRASGLLARLLKDIQTHIHDAHWQEQFLTELASFAYLMPQGQFSLNPSSHSSLPEGDDAAN